MTKRTVCVIRDENNFYLDRTRFSNDREAIGPAAHTCVTYVIITTYLASKTREGRKEGGSVTDLALSRGFVTRDYRGSSKTLSRRQFQRVNVDVCIIHTSRLPIAVECIRAYAHSAIPSRLRNLDLSDRPRDRNDRKPSRNARTSSCIAASVDRLSNPR
jgi:hypothetical protein